MNVRGAGLCGNHYNKELLYTNSIYLKTFEELGFPTSKNQSSHEGRVWKPTWHDGAYQKEFEHTDNKANHS